MTPEQTSESEQRAAVASTVLRMLLGFGGKSLGGLDARAVATQYALALTGLPLWAVEKACQRFAAGSVTPDEIGERHLDRSFPPSSAQIAIVARAIADQEREHVARLQRFSPQAALPPQTESQREVGEQRVRDMLAEYHRSVAKRDLEAAQEEIRKAQLAAERKARTDQNIIDGYLAAGLPAPEVPPGGVLVSLPMMLLCGWVIRKTTDGRAVLEKSSDRSAT